MVANRRVLIVNKSKDSREVLKTAFQRRGMEILEAAAAAEGLALAQRHRPHVIVLDVEDDPAGEATACDHFRTGPASEASLVVLGSAKLCQAERKRRVDPGTPPNNGGSLVAKPYHFAPLIRKIEELAG